MAEKKAYRAASEVRRRIVNQDALDIKYKKHNLKKQIRVLDKQIESNALDQDNINQLKLRDQATSALDDLKWGERISGPELEQKVFDQLPETHQKVIKELQEGKSVIEEA